MIHLRRISSFFLAAGFLVSLTHAQAQVPSNSNPGSVKGILTDESGAVIPAVTVTLTGSGGAKTAQSQADGSYSFTRLAAGQYTVNLNFSGFAPFSRTLTVAPGLTVQLPIQLSLITETQRVTVSAESGPTVSTEPDNNATALVIRGEDLQSLPDDPDDLTAALQALAGPGAGPNGGQIYIDGFSGGQLPPKESIREVRINQNPFSAEYDRLGFGRIEIFTKPGTDRFRGTLFLNDSDAVFDSRNPFASNKPDYSVRNLSFNVGGPLSHRSSFFFDVSRRSITDNSITLATYVDPSSYALIPVTTPVVTPTVQYNISPRFDYQ